MGSPTIPIDPHGDLTLVVGADDDAQSFLVSSKILSVASPVWRAMLSNRNGFVEAGSEEVVFPDDNPEALSIVFLVSHLRFQEVPRKVEFQQLIDLCTVCDKYDCMSLLGPWFSTWTTPWLKHVGENGYEGWAFIAWVAGDVDVFKRTTDDIVLKCTTNKLGQCLTEDGGEVLDQSLTHHGLAGRFCWCCSLSTILTKPIADAILEARNKTLTRLIEACHMMINRYVSNTHLLCKTYTHEEECDTLVFGYAFLNRLPNFCFITFLVVRGK